MFARSVRVFKSSRNSIRFSSANAAVASTASGEGVTPPLKRSIPKLDAYGDIEIPGSRSDRHGSKAGLSWLADDEFGFEDTLSGRLARRRREQGTAPRKTLVASANQGVDGQPMPPKLSTSSSDIVTPQSKNLLHDRQSQSPRGERRQRVNSNNSQAGRRENSAGGPQRNDLRTSISPRSAAGQTKANPRSDAPRGKMSKAKVQNKAKGQFKAGARNAETKTANAEDAVLTSTEGEPKVAKPLRMDIQLTDLGKLFGTPDSPSSPKVGKIDRRASSPRSAAVTRRVQRFLESRGGDYSRYLPQDLGTSLPEELGPLGSARLTMAHNRDIGLRQRQNGLGIMQRYVVTKAIEGGASVPA